jgi:hypothetical protein
MLSTRTDWPDALMEPLREQGDPLADEVIAAIVEGGEISAINTLMRNLVTNEEPLPSALPPVVREYLQATDDLPVWADPAKLAAGERVFWRYGPKLIVVLCCYSLPFCYVGRKGVQVLALTGRLSGNPARRLVETAQLLIDIMQPGGLANPQGRGRRTIQKVRLMHAAVRKLTSAAPEWKAEYGLPVNQEDLAGTLISFSWVAIDGLRRLGIVNTAEDEAAYLHCWQVVGTLLGIRPELIPADLASAKALAEAIARRQFAPCPEGVYMTDALVKQMQYVLPGDLFDGIPPLLIRYFLGAEHATMIGIRDDRFAGVLSGPLRLGGMTISDLMRDSRVIAQITERLGQVLVQSLVYIQRGGNRPSFAIPSELRQKWGVNWTS